MSNRSRLARAMQRGEMQHQQGAVLPFAADPSPPRPTMGPEQIVPFLLSQGELPRWRVAAVGPEGEGPQVVLLDVIIGPIRVPVMITHEMARDMAAKLDEAAAAVVLASPPPVPALAPDTDPDIIVTS